MNNWFGRDTFRDGWQTDRGRYYILLGQPRSIQNYEARDEIYPTELWFYNNSELKRFGLPAFFYLLFWRRHGVGELQLYDPIADGPPALLTGYQPERRDFRDEVERAYEILYEFDPEVANAAMSFRTDEQDITRFQAVPFGSLSLLQDIHEVPFRGLDDSYADRLDFERGAIEADYLFRHVPGHGAMAVSAGSRGRLVPPLGRPGGRPAHRLSSGTRIAPPTTRCSSGRWKPRCGMIPSRSSPSSARSPSSR